MSFEVGFLKDLPLEKSLSAVKECENKITSCSTSAPWRREKPKHKFHRNGEVKMMWDDGKLGQHFNQNYQACSGNHHEVMWRDI